MKTELNIKMDQEIKIIHNDNCIYTIKLEKGTGVYKNDFNFVVTLKDQMPNNMDGRYYLITKGY
jgi:hypothetical protein